MTDSTVNEEILTQLGGMSLKKLLDYHRNYLMEIYIPNWDRAVDWEYGGFANTLNPAEEPNFENKNMYYQGRALWMFSYLYNHITGEQHHLEAAIRGRDFIKKHALTENYHWISMINREGKRLSGLNNHYGDIYIILGLTEIYKATRDIADIELAIHTALSVKERLLSSSNQHIGAVVPALEPGTRRLGDWLHFLHALTTLLKVYDSEEISYLTRYCVRIICERHWQPEERMLLELLTDKFKPFPMGNNKSTGVYSWHAIQACWLVMEEALRVNHQQTYIQGVNMGISTLDQYFREGKGMLCHSAAYDPSLNSVGADKQYPWGALDDMLVYTLMVLEHQHLPNVIDYYNKCFNVHQTKSEDTSGLLHTPRRFFYTIAILERMIRRGYKVSGVLQT